MEENNQELLTTIMSLIVKSGNAKSDAMEAIQEAKQKNFDKAKEKIKSADEHIIEAHGAQTTLLTQEASGNNVEVTLLLVHAQDHLMTSMSFIDLAKEIIELYDVCYKESK
ncbi:PTS lactose/cellobiose transporter subunit IIA [Vagococcus sp. JNUCC 83]